MAYNPNIPQPQDEIPDSQSDLLTNFTDLNTIYQVDHVALNAASNLGKHNKVTLVSQGSDPDMDAPETQVDEVSIFTLKEGTDTELYCRSQSNGTVNQLTKDGELFIRAYPVLAVNIKDLNPGSNVTPGGGNYTISASYNLNTGSSQRLTASKCHYLFTFTTPF